MKNSMYFFAFVALSNHGVHLAMLKRWNKSKKTVLKSINLRTFKKQIGPIFNSRTHLQKPVEVTPTQTKKTTVWTSIYVRSIKKKIHANINEITRLQGRTKEIVERNQKIVNMVLANPIIKKEIATQNITYTLSATLNEDIKEDVPTHKKNSSHCIFSKLLETLETQEAYLTKLDQKKSSFSMFYRDLYKKLVANDIIYRELIDDVSLYNQCILCGQYTLLNLLMKKKKKRESMKQKELVHLEIRKRFKDPLSKPKLISQPGYY